MVFFINTRKKINTRDCARDIRYFFDPSPLTRRGTINTNPILQQPNNNTYYPFHVASK